MLPSERAVAAGQNWFVRSLPLQELEAVDLAFGLTAAPGLGQGDAHSCLISFQSIGKGRNGKGTARPGLGQPDIQFGDWVRRSVAVPPACDAASPRDRRELAGKLHNSRSLLVLLDTGGCGRIDDAEGCGGLDR